MSETWPTNATLKREHDQLLADHRETMVRLRDLRDEFRDFKRHAAANLASLNEIVTEMTAVVTRLAGETEAAKPSPAVSTRAEQANPVTVEAAELAVPGTGLANPAHFVQYAVRTPDRIQVYGDQSWVKHGTAAAGHPDGGADTVVRDIWVSYDPWRTYKAGEAEVGKPAADLTPDRKRKLGDTDILDAFRTVTGWSDAEVLHYESECAECDPFASVACDANPAVIAAREGVEAAAEAIKTAGVRQCSLDIVDDCPNLVVWRWWPNGRPGVSVWLCDEHAAGIDLSDLEDLTSPAGLS